MTRIDKRNSRYKQTVSALLAAVGILSVAAAAGCSRGGEQAKEGGEKAAGAPAGAPGTPAAQEATPVEVAPAVVQTVTSTVPVTGSVAALQSVDLSPKISAKVVSVSGREGQTVRRGQVVVQQDTSDLQRQVQQAQANVRAAQARVAQAETQARLQRTTSNAGVADAQQQLKSAQAQLALAKRPQRTQEVAVAENAVAQAQANYDRAATDRKRYEDLVKQGAAAQITLDQYVNQERVARAALDSAKQQLEIAQTGGRSESVQQAQAAVARAESALRLARSNVGQNEVRQDEIRAARATVAQVKAALALAQQQVADAAIRSPIDGVISERLTEPGQFAGPGTAVLRLVKMENVYFEAQVPETNIGSIRAGMPVQVRADAYPGRVFSGKVEKIYPQGNASSRTFNVRVVIPNAGKLLRPGLFARGEVVTERRQGVVVPKDALLAEDGQFQVFVVEDGARAERRTVKVGIQTEDTSEILSGVQANERVIVTGNTGLKDGAQVQVTNGGAGRQRTAMAQ